MKRISYEQSLLFNEPNSPQLVLDFIKDGECLCDGAQLLMLDLENALELVEIYTHKFPLCDEAELKLFELHDAEKFIKVYIKEFSFCREAEVKLFELENAKEVVEEYIKFYPFFHDAELKLLELKDAEDLIRGYLLKYNISEVVQQTLIKQGKFDLLKKYVTG